jgi:hypothetical protein
MSDINPSNMSREELETTAKDLGLSFPHNIGDDGLRKKIAEALGGDAISLSKSAPVATGNAKERQFEIIIATHEQDKQPVQGGINGKSFVIKRGEKAVVSESIVEVLKCATQHHYDPGTMERTEVQSYPFQIIREVTDEA